MQGASPRIAVLLPAFDAARTLPSCLRSVAAQSEPRFVCLIVDDGSSDGTAAVAQAFAAEDARFVLVQSPAGHQGLVAALGLGLARCEAPFVARMDADDLMRRDRLARQLRALEQQPDLAAVGCHVRVFPLRPMTDGLRRYERWLNQLVSAADVEREAFVECPVAHPSLMFRTSVLRRHGYRDRGWAEDYDLVLRVLGAGQRIGMVPEPLLLWRDGPQRMWRTHAAYEPQRFTAAKAWFLAQGFLAGADRYVLWGYGSTGRALRKALLAHGKEPSHIVELHPGRLGQRIHGAPVIPPEALGELSGQPILVSVAGEQPRRQIRDELSDLGLTERSHYICCA
ncbi:MAG: glycosyltransferase [Deltaproteobacteria bacterium]|jgi:glycosyltransferase involved in cell wall biosynthesis|nr:glycosyltransferase [Deltaproteobacteria bacterium]MBW2535191.1 glycosyltransferase [Deltaproteobacteria bacterium]